jgi:4a-hydroxytetrahydrobiopterin dehydratase
MTDDRGRHSFSEVAEVGLDDWRMLFRALHARFLTENFATGLALVARIGEVAEKLDHHPDLDLRYPRLDVRLSSHDVGGVTDRDLELARRISGLAADLGVGADPSGVQVLELALDTSDFAGIKPFWRAVLGLSDSRDEREVVDSAGSLPTLWFQETTAHEEPRQRFHLDIRVPPEVAEARIAAALEAGGVLVSDEQAPRFVVLADVQGNKACVTTGLGRD